MPSRYITPPGAVGIRAELTVPIISGDQVLGVLNIFSEDDAADPRYVARLGSAIRAELVVPIVVNDRLLGVLNIESTRAIDAEDAAEIEIIADQFAVAMENVRLAERGQQLAVLEERRAHPGDLSGLAQRVYAQISKIVAGPWQLATGEDPLNSLLEPSAGR